MGRTRKDSGKFGTAESNRQEMREAINNLIIANEGTRDLANKVAELAVNVSRRFTRHERDHN
ncbi:MAG TPA: hypothetical protein VI756_01925 [Blastocatellia bacterium]